MHKTNVLLPLDGSPFSRKVMPTVRRFLQPAETRLILLRVVSPPEGMTGSPPRLVSAAWWEPLYETTHDAQQARHPIYASQTDATLRATIVAELQPDLWGLRDAGYEVTVVVGYGDPATAIVDVATQEHVELIAMATHARTGLGQVMLGSIAQHVLHNAPMPVLLVRPCVKPEG